MSDAAEMTSVVIPALDECITIGPLVTELTTVARWHEVLVVDDGARDDTADRAAAAGAAIWTIVTQAHVTNSSVLLIVLSVVILLIGLVSEQISTLRFEGRNS